MSKKVRGSIILFADMLQRQNKEIQALSKKHAQEMKALVKGQTEMLQTFQRRLMEIENKSDED